ncbi:MAG: TRAP transporter large permease subunit [Myxococcales bacterium]|nr:TRAP transporter large permease subunit [Myxococcales bacterium]
MAGAAPSSKPAPFLKPLDTVDRGILLAESAMSLVVVVAMVAMAVGESGTRLMAMAINKWGTQATLDTFMQKTASFSRFSGDFLMHGTLFAAFLGASFATRGRRHLAIDVLGRLLRPRGKHTMAAVANTLGSVIAFALAKGIFGALMEAVHNANSQAANAAASGLDVSTIDRSFYFQFVIPAGFLLIAIRLLMHGYHEFVAVFRNDPAIDGSAKPADAEKAEGDEEAKTDGAPYREGEGKDGEEQQPVLGPPVAYATATEIGIALVTLFAMLVPALGTLVFKPLLGAVLLAVPTLAIPLALRKKKQGHYGPTMEREPEPDVKFDVAHLGMAAGAALAVLAFCYVAGGQIPKVPIWGGVLFFFTMALLGAPLFTFLGGMAIFLWIHGTTSVQPQALSSAMEDALGPHFARMSVLPTIPVFTLAGYLMSESKTPQRLVRVARALLGAVPGGLAVVCLLASAFFTIFSGASGITIVAIGGLLYPALIRDKYPEKFSLGLVTTGGALGITFPPCLPLIVYGIVAGLQEAPPGKERLELQKFMLAGILPGVLLLGLLIVYAIVMGVVSKAPRSKFDAKEAGAALWEAKWELLLPVFLLVGLAKGIFNPSQAAAFTAFYVLIIEVFIYKDLSITKDLPRIIPESMVLVGAIFVKLCAATVLTAFFIDAQVADKLFESLTCGPQAMEYMRTHADSIGTCREAVNSLARQHLPSGGIINSPISFLIALNFFLLIVGMLMDIFSAIVVIVPLIAGIALHFDINPYHLGIVFLLNLEIGYLMPPMGLNLFIAAFRFNKPVPDLYRTVLPFITIFVIALLATTYIPKLTLVMVPGQNQSTTSHNTGTGTTGTNTTVTPAAGDGGTIAVPPAGDCDVPGENESFDDFQRRCSGAGAGGGTTTPAATTDCDVPRENESYADFEVRCNPNGASDGGASESEGGADDASTTTSDDASAPAASGTTEDAAAPSNG